MPSLLSLGSKAPDFNANSTFGPLKLSDYNGKWVVLFSHPGDFTPVCTTEFLSFAKYSSEFKKRNTALIGLSVDSNSSHLAWMYNIFQLTGVEIPFPVIEDCDKHIANMYGMISESTCSKYTIRAVFIIDDKQILRTILYYPPTTGRNIPEIIRIIEALQTSDSDNVSTPANWFPGTPVVMPYPKTYKELKDRVKSCNKQHSCLDWYLCFMPDKKALSGEVNMNDYMSSHMSKSKKVKIKKEMSRPQITDVYDQPSDKTFCPNVTPIVVSYTLGNPKNLDTRFIDAAIYAFVEINPDGTLFVPSPTYLKQMVNLKKEKPELKVIAAIGGWGAEGFSDAAFTPSSRYEFARQVNKLIQDYNLDGIDLDWEYPSTSAAGIKFRPEDKENYPLLMTAIRDVIGYDKWLSVAGVGDQFSINRSFDLEKIAPLVDYFNLMSYDFTAGETGERGRVHQANLYGSELGLNGVDGYSADKWVNNLINSGMPAEKILFGVPFYGRLGATTTKSYDELRANFINKNGYVFNFDDIAKVPYLTKDGVFAMSYDDPLSIYFKSEYVLQNCLGGIFDWTTTYDQGNILAKAMYDGINDPYNFKEELEDIYGDF